MKSTIAFSLVEPTRFSLANTLSLRKRSPRWSKADNGVRMPSKGGMTYKTGFSLVELSIVLVILGLLTGGILTGQSLIRAAELRSVTTEFQAYQTAVMTFCDQYFQIPGDMNNATDFWGAMTNCGAASPSGTGTQTCNGDGDGSIEYSPGSSRDGESFAFWKQLANAGLIEGDFTGISGSGGQVHSIIGTNIPDSKMSAAGWNVAYGVTSGGVDFFDGNHGNHFRYGSENGSGIAQIGVLSPKEIWGVDKKIDDGMPAQGKVIVRPRSSCTLAADGSAMTTSAADAAKLDAIYKLSETDRLCAPVFRNLF